MPQVVEQAPPPGGSGLGGVPGRFLSVLATVLATGAAKLMPAIYLLSPLKGQNHFSGTLAFTADLTDELLPGARLHFRVPALPKRRFRLDVYMCLPCQRLWKNQTADP